MSNNTSEPLVTYEAYCAMPEDVRCELIDGALYMTPAPTVLHQLLVIRIAAALESFVRPQKLGLTLAGPTDVILREVDPALVLQPDILFVSNERRPILRRRGVFGAPNLAIEVLSPSNPRHDTVTKRKLYAVHGVEEYWLVLPDAEQIQVFRFGSEGAFAQPTVHQVEDVLTTPLVPGFELSLADLFERDIFPDTH